MPKQKKTQSRPKRLYRVGNWSEYEKALVARGSITFWLSEDFEKNWLYTGEKQRGSQFDYSDKAIEIMLTLKEIFHLTNRSTEGFVRSLFRMMKVDLPVPDHTTLSKRSKILQVKLPKKSSGSLNLVMDSTGLKVYGEGEWKVRKHGYSKHRTWCKLHLGGQPDTGEILAATLTGNHVSDDAVVQELLAQIGQALLSCAADGAYDKRKVYNALNEHTPEVEILIPPRKNAHIWQHGNSKSERLKRDENLRYTRQHGRHQWKADSGYHIRSLAETCMFRLKTIFGDQLSARLPETQTTQAMIRCTALNRMTYLGMPDRLCNSYSRIGGFCSFLDLCTKAFPTNTLLPTEMPTPTMTSIKSLQAVNGTHLYVQPGWARKVSASLSMLKVARKNAGKIFTCDV